MLPYPNPTIRASFPWAESPLLSSRSLRRKSWTAPDPMRWGEDVRLPGGAPFGPPPVRAFQTWMQTQNTFGTAAALRGCPRLPSRKGPTVRYYQLAQPPHPSAPHLIPNRQKVVAAGQAGRVDPLRRPKAPILARCFPLQRCRIRDSQLYRGRRAQAAWARFLNWRPLWT